MVKLFDSDIDKFLNNNEFGITERDLKSDRLEVLEIIVFFKISDLMDIVKSRSKDFMSSQTYLGLSNQLSNTKANLKYHLEYLKGGY